MSEAVPNTAPWALAHLLHYRWALPILAQVANERGCKFVTLRKRLSVAPQTLTRTLGQLSALDLVVPNPNYGHPLRPEYVLGKLGNEVAKPSQAIWHWIQRSEVEGPMLKKWSLPTLAAVGLGAQRFHEIRTLLTEATPRATTLALKDLIAADLATRRIDNSYPPTPHYKPTRQTRTALHHIYALSAPLARKLAG